MSTPAAQFKQDARRLSADLRHRQTIQTAMGKYEVARDQRKAAFQDWQGARQMAAETKWEAVNHLDQFQPAHLGHELAWRVLDVHLAQAMAAVVEGDLVRKARA